MRDLVTLIAQQAGALERVRFGALLSRAAEPPVIAGDARRLGDEVGFRPAIVSGAGRR